MKTTHHHPLIALIFLIALLLQPGPLPAAVIDFETNIPGHGAPTDGMAITNQFEPLYHIIFSLENGGGLVPRLAGDGGALTAFFGFNDGVNDRDDHPHPTANAGTFFLTDDGTAGIPFNLIVTCTQPASAASGIVLDIDAAEEWTVQARDQAGVMIEEIILPPNNLLDGSATPWSFDHGSTADIYSIRFAFTGTGNATTGNVGVAFDNFDVTIIPEPSAALLVLGAAMLGIRRRRAIPARTPSALAPRCLAFCAFAPDLASATNLGVDCEESTQPDGTFTATVVMARRAWGDTPRLTAQVSTPPPRTSDFGLRACLSY